MRMSVPIALLVAALSTGCGWRKAHLTKDHGKSFDAAFAAQAVDRPVPAVAVKGLDPQEAALLSAGYRARLAPPGTEADQASRTILVAPQDPNRARLAPSVPRE